MMKQEPINYNNPLGISKREWTRVLGVNLALLLIVYTIALITTLSGNDFFLLSVDNPYLADMEAKMRSWNIYPLVQIGFATVEETIILSFSTLRKPKWWWIVTYFGLRTIINIILANTLGYMPSFVPFLFNLLFSLAVILVTDWKNWQCYVRFVVALVISLALNECIAIFRTKVSELWHIYTNIPFFYLSIEYDIALSLSLGLLALAIPWTKGENQWSMITAVGGSSPTSTNSLRKNSPTKNELPPKVLKKIRWIKTRLFVIQTVALVFICLFPVLVGKPAEFAMMYVSFCLTRLVLGFKRSLHFKSEYACIGIGTLVFWFITILIPSVEVSIILSLVYGAGLALGFRLYWELHDLLVYKRASKNDRYAMMFVVFKGNVEARHIRGVMLAKGYTDEDEIKIVQLYMQKEKVEWIAQYMCFAKITIEKKLTEIATALYQQR